MQLRIERTPEFIEWFDGSRLIRGYKGLETILILETLKVSAMGSQN
jgi:hypothetical protein